MCIEKIPSPDDWRRQGQEKYLMNKTLVKGYYISCRVGWDHDHCEFCGNKFSLADKDSLKHGYSTLDYKHWICEDCFEDFICEYRWRIINKRSMT